MPFFWRLMRIRAAAGMPFRLGVPESEGTKDAQF
jgi:hypothetical protein